MTDNTDIAVSLGIMRTELNRLTKDLNTEEKAREIGDKNSSDEIASVKNDVARLREWKVAVVAVAGAAGAVLGYVLKLM